MTRLYTPPLTLLIVSRILTLLPLFFHHFIGILSQLGQIFNFVYFLASLVV